MKMVDLIAKKRDGEALSTEEIDYFIRQYTAEEIPDYQTAALLMAVYLKGMNRRETVDLTLAMARSGEQLDLHDVAPFVVDKHSSGGVGDKTSLAVLPLVAACGVPVGKMSGRGLGSSGGTIDKMESLNGWSPSLKLGAFKRQLAEVGLVLSGQTADLAPADGKLYALRDVTATVANTSLIAASIMSKKLAAGADGIVLDVKAGSGAFMPSVEAAKELARIMVDIGIDAGRRMVALISDMNQPLGHAIGNALEVKEAIAILQGEGPEDFWDHSREVAAQMLVVAGKADSLAAAYEMVQEARGNGRAFEKFRGMVEAQGGDVRQVDNTDLLPQAEHVAPLIAPRSGTIAAMDTGAIGWASVHLGGGRFVKTDKLDHGVGFLLPVKIGDTVQEGDELGQIHANSQRKLAEAQERLLAALSWSDEAVERRPLFYGTVQ